MPWRWCHTQTVMRLSRALPPPRERNRRWWSWRLRRDVHAGTTQRQPSRSKIGSRWRGLASHSAVTWRSRRSSPCQGTSEGLAKAAMAARSSATTAAGPTRWVARSCLRPAIAAPAMVPRRRREPAAPPAPRPRSPPRPPTRRTPRPPHGGPARPPAAMPPARVADRGCGRGRRAPPSMASSSGGTAAGPVAAAAVWPVVLSRFASSRTVMPCARALRSHPRTPARHTSDTSGASPDGAARGEALHPAARERS
jgi:hypothetical protein